MKIVRFVLESCTFRFRDYKNEQFFHTIKNLNDNWLSKSGSFVRSVQRYE